jgi:hypothetical protein
VVLSLGGNHAGVCVWGDDLTCFCRDGFFVAKDVAGGPSKPLRCPKCNRTDGRTESEVPPEVVMDEIARDNEINGTVPAKVRAA